jgi:hypothetical protein
MDDYKYKIVEIAEDMAGEDGLDYSELSDKQQMGYYKKAYEFYLDRDPNAMGGQMIRENYAMGSEDIPEIEETSSEEYKELLRQMGAPTETQESGIMGLKEGAPSIKMAGGADPMLLREYEQYVFEMREMGRDPMPLKDFIRQIIAEARMGVKAGGITSVM